MVDPGAAVTTAAAAHPWRKSGDTVVLRVRLTPKGGRDAIEGVTTTADGPALKARVRAAPENGAANAALIECIAKWLDLPKRDVAIATGHKSRVKDIAVSGEPGNIVCLIEAALAKL